MASQEASDLRNDWMGKPDEEFEYLTFDNLEPGDRFIHLPAPGKEEEDEGFFLHYTAFIKTEASFYTEEENGEMLEFVTNAISTWNGETCHFAGNEAVVLLNM